MAIHFFCYIFTVNIKYKGVKLLSNFSTKHKARAWVATIHITNMEKAGLTKEQYEKPEFLADFFIRLWTDSGSNRTAGIAVCISEAGLYHCHMALYGNTTTLHNVSKILFDSHVEPQLGGKKELTEYLSKTGKYSEKGERVLYTQGLDCIEDKQGARTDLSDLYENIKGGMTDYEIFEENPNNIRHIGYIEKVRQTLVKESVKNTFRTLEVTYIWGKTAIGKTRYVMEKYGYSSVFRITDYKHPFDNYIGQDIIVFDEFASSFVMLISGRHIQKYILFLTYL